VVPKLEVFDYSQSFERFAKANTVRENATVMRIDLVDCALYAILLELKERPPYLRLNDLGVLKKEAARVLRGQKPLEDVIERLEVDEFGRVIRV
jgi:hypothetical protein